MYKADTDIHAQVQHRGHAYLFNPFAPSIAHSLQTSLICGAFWDTSREVRPRATRLVDLRVRIIRSWMLHPQAPKGC